jgi:hypothetical protein
MERSQMVQVIRLYRGIAVPSMTTDETTSHIRQNGIRGDEGSFWRSLTPDVVSIRSQLDAMFEQGDLTVQDVFKNAELPAIGACGGPIGAMYYAARHNRSSANDLPIVIEFDAPLDRVWVDNRDFLCTVFQLWDYGVSPTRHSDVLGVLIDLYGRGIERYFESASSDSEQDRRIVMCNLAAFDADVVLSHYRNQKVIRGRHNTHFESAFVVQCPIPPADVRYVYPFDTYELPTPDVTLDGALGRE